MAAQSDACQRVAWLRDVVEDSDVTIDDLRKRLPDEEVEAVLLLTHRADEPYEDYIDRLARAERPALLGREVCFSASRSRPGSDG